jgi:hypothetical protein
MSDEKVALNARIDAWMTAWNARFEAQWAAMKASCNAHKSDVNHYCNVCRPPVPPEPTSRPASYRAQRDPGITWLINAFGITGYLLLFGGGSMFLAWLFSY